MYSACSKLSVQGHLAILKNPMIRMAANFHKKLVKYGVLILRTLYCSFKVVCIDGVDNCTGQLWEGSVDRSFLVLIKINPIVESGYFCSKHKTWSLHCCSCCESEYRRVWPGATEFKSLNVIPPVTLVPWRSICCPSFKVLKRFSQFSYPR